MKKMKKKQKPNQKKSFWRRLFFLKLQKQKPSMIEVYIHLFG